ncbi:MAG: [protein-PII] uridylyltransferase [Candidatus Latescibacterota bacterium]|nr:[protein-PII] uridylyltransferase [Candidatus Latescibacterota bacterium]
MNKKIDISSKLVEITGLGNPEWNEKVHELILSVHETEKTKLLTSFDSPEVMRSLSECMDLVVIEVFKRTVGLNANGIAVIAVGGFGRREMSFYSDVDLMFLMGKSYDPKNNYISEILHVLWDFHLDIGYSSRTISEALKLAKEDIESCTAMMDGRLLVGDEEAFSDFYEKLYLNVPNNLPEKLNRWRFQRIENDSSVQLLEPNIKESPGALRDIQSLQWAIKSKMNSRSNEIRWPDFLEENDIETIEKCWRFLSSIRLHLHAIFCRKRDVLDADAKVQVSIALGYEDSETELGVEFFMRDYYQNARSVFQIVNLTFERFTRKRRVSARTMYLEHGLMSIDNEIVIKDGREYFSQDPFRMLKIFSLLQRKKLILGEVAKRAVQLSLDLIDENFRCSSEARDVFFKILSGKMRVASTLRLMHELGVLDAYLPEFGRLNCLVQFNPYHIYTVDEHTLVAIRNLEALLQGRRRERLSNVFEDFGPKSILFFSVLMHDVGKYRRTDHISAGVEIAQELAERLDLPGDQRDLFVFLIRKHQEMVLISRRRDLEDDEMIVEFAKEFKATEYLDGLYLLSYADLSAVSPEAWTEWQAALLWELYDKTGVKLDLAIIPEENERLSTDLLEKHVATVEGKWSSNQISMLRSHVNKMPEKYPATYELNQIEAHINMVQDLDGNRAYGVDFIEREDFTEIVICTRDRRQVLAKICGALAVNDLNVLRADIITSCDQIVLDTFQVTNIDGGAKLDDWKKERVVDRISDVLEKGKKARELLEMHSSNWSQRNHPEHFDETKVEIDNQSSRNYTVLDIDARDDVGLLYRITHALVELGLDIHMALIDTVVGRASDAFYVTDRVGEKIEDHNMMDIVRQRIIFELDESVIV